jgi:dUTP pyrophosphatase
MSIEVKLKVGKYDLINTDIGNAGYDICASKNGIIRPREILKFSTDIYTEFPNTMYARIAPRSGLGLKGIDVFGGVIDSNYRGEIGVILFNSTATDFHIYAGDKIAQLIFTPVIHPTFTKINNANELSNSVRGDAGYGSSGMR